jgi:hypothetical protein
MTSSFTSFSQLTENKSHEADIIRRTRFFHVIDTRASNIIIKDVCETENVNHNTEKE